MDSVAFCLIGALRSAARALGADVYTLRRAERSVGESLDSEPEVGPDDAHYFLSDWNEEPGRTKDEVIALVERTLERRRVTA